MPVVLFKFPIHKNKFKNIFKILIDLPHVIPDAEKVPLIESWCNS